MFRITRRDVLKAGAGTLIGTAFAGTSIEQARAATELRFAPEAGAQLNVLRWDAFVKGDEDAWTANSRKFTELTGVPVSIEAVPWETVRSKAAEIANSGSGPDIALGWFDDPQQYPHKLVDVSLLATYLGEKYGGWYPVCERYGRYQGQWIALPLCTIGQGMVYRQSHVEAAGFASFPGDTDGLLKLCQALAKAGTPPGFALGHAVGDANNFTHWLLWSFGGKLVDTGGIVVINSTNTWAALEYARELYQTFVPGTESWDDADNNEAFLSGRISLTNNAVSIYQTAKHSADLALQDMAGDIQHAAMPVGLIGTPTELFLFSQAMVFGHTRYPDAAREYLRFMWEREQYEPWQLAASGYVTQTLKDYEQNSIWRDDPRYLAYKDSTARMLWNGYVGELGAASAAAMAHYVVVDMFAEAASGKRTPREAALQAEKRAQQYYRFYPG